MKTEKDLKFEFHDKNWILTVVAQYIDITREETPNTLQDFVDNIATTPKPCWELDFSKLQTVGD